MSTRRPSLLDAINLEHAFEFSYAAHHVDSIEYLNLFRSEHLTLKAYFFPEGSYDEVVVPHDHRYDFTTTCVRGFMSEQRYRVVTFDGRGVENVDELQYDCLVDGGAGFTHVGEARLRLESTSTMRKGKSWDNQAHVDIHTLANVRPGTILLLTQFRDVGTATTRAWTRPGTMPPVGSYEKMERATIKSRIDELQAALEVM